MVAVSFTKFRQNAKDYFDAVEKGEKIRVLRHGKVIAEIVSPDRKKPSWKKNISPLVIPGVSLTKSLMKDRKAAR
jgi:antitoxin (DNA-binding transcriptional repressor) of toxin-antitoxin stability system